MQDTIINTINTTIPSIKGDSIVASDAISRLDASGMIVASGIPWLNQQVARIGFPMRDCKCRINVSFVIIVASLIVSIVTTCSIIVTGIITLTCSVKVA